MSSISRDLLQKTVEDYLILLKKTANPNSIPSKFQGIRHFCVMNRIDLNWDIIRKIYPPKQKTQTLRSYDAGEIQRMLACASLRDAALVHFLASTGARIGAFDHYLTMDHLKPMPGGCRAVKIYSGSVEEYWTFLTPQASNALEQYHHTRKEAFGKDAPIFAARTGLQLGWSGARSAIYRTIQKSGITRQKHNGRCDVQADHGFRKRFNTILKLSGSVNYNIAEKLMGHKNGLDGVYLTPTLDELFAEFAKVINALEIPRGPKQITLTSNRI